jgi:4-hydroxybutyrate CoA-transferase
MDWKTWYSEHLCTAQEAVRRIKSGDRVVVAHATGEPSYVLDAMVANAAQYKNVEVVHMVAMGKAEYCKPEYDANFHHNSFFLGGTTRAAASEGRADFTPVYFSEIPGVLRDCLHPNVAMIQVSPPDEHGYCSLGVSVDYTKTAAEIADLVIAQVNQQMPRTLGDSFLHVSQLDCIVETDLPVIELAPPKITEVERAIGENVATLIKDGDTLQLGIGAIPDAVLLFLKEKNDLGIHTEMFSDGVVELAEAGVITNKKKTLHPGKSVATFLMGTRRLYDYVDNNPAVAMYPVEYVNDPYVIAQNDNLVSINSCVQIDIQGQVVSTSAGLRQISGVGGQIDFVRGANMSKGGRAIMAMPSMTNKGVSKIVTMLDPGSAVTTPRNDVNYVVTEYGIAQLRGKSLRKRAEELIAIAHPSVRDEMRAEFRRRFPKDY